MGNIQTKCACGCGQSLEKYDKWGRSRNFILGHRYPSPPLKITSCIVCGNLIEMRRKRELLVKKYCSKKCFAVGMSRRKHSEETKQKMSKSGVGRKLSEETKLKISRAHKGKFGRQGKDNGFYGKKHTLESRLKMSIFSKFRSQEMSEAMKIRWQIGELSPDEGHPHWKGDNVGYAGLHTWVKKMLGRPNICEHCGGHFEYPHIQWANKSGNYKRVLSDWLRLCVSCHKKYDLKRLSSV